MYREEIPLIIAPFRSVEGLSPQVLMNSDTSISIRFRSNVRDKTEGALYLDDAVVSSPQRQVELGGKNSIVTDTLPLRWKDTILAAPREVTIRAGRGNPVGSFIVRSMNVRINTKKRVEICSAVENGPVQIALRRLGVATTLLDTTNFSGKDLADNSVIIIDQFSFKKFLGLGKQLDSVEQWIDHGGRLIILPQYATKRTNRFLWNDIAFTQWSVSDCKEKLYIDSTDRVFHVPNKIDKNSFTGAPFTLSYSQIAETKSDNSKVLMKSGTRVLLLEKRLEKGDIFYCAMNLFPRLLDIDKASYELLANLLSMGSQQ